MLILNNCHNQSVTRHVHVHQTSHVVCKGASSDPFSISNGVRQGSVLSPILFIYYTDNLIKEIVTNKIGCKISTVFNTGFSVKTRFQFIICQPTLKGII